MSKLFKAQINQIPKEPELYAVVEFLCSESNKLYNCALYLARQLYFKEKKYANKFYLASELKTNPHMRSLYTSAAQQTCISVGEAIRGYQELAKAYFQGEISDKPKLPRYRKKGLYQLRDMQKIRYQLGGNNCDIPFG